MYMYMYIYKYIYLYTNSVAFVRYSESGKHSELLKIGLRRFGNATTC